jgi:hypothetical protein
MNQIVYNFTARLQLEQRKLNNDLVVPVRQAESELRLQSLRGILAAHSGCNELDRFFTDHPYQALALTFRDPLQAATGEDMLTAPAPEIRMLDCSDRNEWERLLWEFNQPLPDGRRQYTVLLHRPEDFLRLQRAVMVKLILELNGGRVPNSLLKFVPGRMLEIPEMTNYGNLMLDAETARYFFYSTPHFFTTLVEEIDRRLIELERELEQLKAQPSPRLPAGGHDELPFPSPQPTPGRDQSSHIPAVPRRASLGEIQSLDE